MKKLLCICVLLLVFVMQSFTFIPGLTPVLLRIKEPKLNGGMPGPSRSPRLGMESTIEVYLNESSDSLLLNATIGESVTYYINNVEDSEVCNGVATFSEQGDASIYLGTLDEGTYTISLELDSLVYEGEFERN